VDNQQNAPAPSGGDGYCADDNAGRCAARRKRAESTSRERNDASRDKAGDRPGYVLVQWPLPRFLEEVEGVSDLAA
jgi:hypothetical protein